jgi:hypothetical protein
MSSESIQSVAYDYDDFQHVNFIFSQIFISLFWGWQNWPKGKKVVMPKQQPFLPPGISIALFPNQITIREVWLTKLHLICC